MARCLAGFLSSDKQRRVVHIGDVLPRNSSDETWIRWVGAEPGHWIVVSKDRKIKTVPAERRAFMEAKIRLVAIMPALIKMQNNEQCARLIQQWPAIEAALSRFDPPIAVGITGKWNDKLKSL